MKSRRSWKPKATDTVCAAGMRIRDAEDTAEGAPGAPGAQIPAAETTPDRVHLLSLLGRTYQTRAHRSQVAPSVKGGPPLGTACGTSKGSQVPE